MAAVTVALGSNPVGGSAADQNVEARRGSEADEESGESSAKQIALVAAVVTDQMVCDI